MLVAEHQPIRRRAFIVENRKFACDDAAVIAVVRHVAVSRNDALHIELVFALHQCRNRRVERESTAVNALVGLIIDSAQILPFGEGFHIVRGADVEILIHAVIAVCKVFGHVQIQGILALAGKRSTVIGCRCAGDLTGHGRFCAADKELRCVFRVKQCFVSVNIGCRDGKRIPAAWQTRKRDGLRRARTGKIEAVFTADCRIAVGRDDIRLSRGDTGRVGSGNFDGRGFVEQTARNKRCADFGSGVVKHKGFVRLSCRAARRCDAVVQIVFAV